MTNSYRRGLWATCLTVLLVIFPALSRAAVPDYQSTVLPNKLHVVYKVIPGAPDVMARFVVPVGILNEPEQNRGIAHLLEHMIYRGNSKNPPAEFHKLVDWDGGIYNGTTDLERTEYYMDVLPANLIPALSLYLDYILHPDLTEPDIVLEKKIISVEKALRTNPGDTFFLYLNELTQHRMDAATQSITRKDLVAFQQQFYRLDRMTLILTGNFKPDDVFKMLNQYQSPSTEGGETPGWLFHDTLNNIVLEDELPGEQYRILFSFELKDLSSRNLVVAKVLPYILEYESRQYDHLNDKPLDYQIELLSLAGHYYLVFNYRDTQDQYSLEIETWHRKNLERYCKYLASKKLDGFLSWFAKTESRFLDSLVDDAWGLNEYYDGKLFDPTVITTRDLDTIRRISSGDIRKFVDKYLAGQYSQKIVVKAL